MKFIANITKAIVLLFAGLFIFFMLKMDKPNSVNYPSNQVSSADLKSISATISKLQQGYERRDVSKIDDCIKSTIDSSSIFILGTSPNEIFKGKQGACNLLWGDWTYWGDVRFDLSRLFVDTLSNNMAYVVFPGTIRIGFCGLTFPLQVSGVMIDRNGQWLFSKMQFQYAWNTNYIIYAKIAALGTLFALVLLFFIQLVRFVCNRRKVA